MGLANPTSSDGRASLLHASRTSTKAAFSGMWSREYSVLMSSTFPLTILRCTRRCCRSNRSFAMGVPRSRLREDRGIGQQSPSFGRALSTDRGCLRTMSHASNARKGKDEDGDGAEPDKETAIETKANHHSRRKLKAAVGS